MKRVIVSDGPFQVNEAVLCLLNIPYTMDAYGNCDADISPEDERLLRCAEEFGIENISGNRNTFRIVEVID